MEPFGGLVVGASDVAASVGFFETFGFVVTDRTLDSDLRRCPLVAQNIGEAVSWVLAQRQGDAA